MKSIIWALLFLTPPLFSQTRYHYQVDLRNIVDDQVAVTLDAPEIQEEKVIFSFPKVIPGSYSNKDFGRFISDFHAFDRRGNTLKIKRLNTNQFQISKASTLGKVTYKVADTWDTKGDNFVFQPGGSNIEEGKNIVLNNHAFFGYFEGYKRLPFNIDVLKPASFFGATNLTTTFVDAEHDMLQARDYFNLADNPVLYAVPDTTSFKVGNSTIHIAVYSATAKVKSPTIGGYLRPMCAALAKFFDGLPVISYQFLFFFDDPKKALTGAELGGYGALEHNYSSLYYLPEIANKRDLCAMVNEVTSHEFLHIQTPLNLHSKEIVDFNFIKPAMSQHLWLYEGVTEYFANLVQLQNGLISEEGFFNTMRDKEEQAERYGQFSMTKMSRYVLTPEYQSKYESVYNKGALIALALDLFIRAHTGNQNDLKKVVEQLSQKYGPDKPFDDDSLFMEFARFSNADVLEFFDRYVIGDSSLPLNQMLSTIGYEFAATKRKNLYGLGGSLALRYEADRKQYIFINVTNNVLGIKEADKLLSVAGTKVTDENLDTLWKKFFQSNTTEPLLSITVLRNGREEKLSAALQHGFSDIANFIGPVDLPSAAQLAARHKFIEGD